MENSPIYKKILSYPRVIRNNKILLISFLELPLGIFYYICLGEKRCLNIYLEIINK